MGCDVGWFNMAVELDEYFCNLQFGGMDIGTTLLVGWIVFALFLVLLGVFVYNRHLKPRKVGQDAVKNEPESASKDDATAVGLQSSSFGGKFPFTASGKSGVVIPTATVTGVDKDAVEWVNRAIHWVYNDPAVSHTVVQLWMRNINALTATSMTEHGVKVSFEKIEADSLPPTINNAVIEVSPKDEITLTFNAIITRLTFTVNTSRQKGDIVLAPVYQATVINYAGKLKVTCNPYTLVTTLGFVDHPNLRVALKPVSGHQTVEALDEQALQDVLDEIITNALANWRLQINFTQFHNCPVFKRAPLEAQPIKPIHYDSMMSPLLPPIPPRSKKDKRLLVKVIKAAGLGSARGCHEPYCIIEIDEPPQRHQTTFIKDTNSPFWDEHFLFDLSGYSSELLFELYDKSKSEKDAFLGLGIISVDELLKNPSQRQIIPLQSRPYEEDKVSGSLTVEFLFMEAVDIPVLSDNYASQSQPSPIPKARTETNRLLIPGGAMVTTTTTTISKPTSGTEVFCSKLEIEKVVESTPDLVADVEPEKEDDKEQLIDAENQPIEKQDTPDADVIVNGGDPVTDTALRELEYRQFVPAPPATTTNKSTLIIHSVQRPPEVIVVDGEKLLLESYQNANKPATSDSISSSVSSSTKDGTGRSRPKDRRSFMNTLRKRFSFRNKRSKSMEQRGDGNISGDESMSRSASADRAHGPGGPQPEVGSVRSSVSENSAMSESSTQTYLSEMSTLVIETIENGVMKHYLLPASMANKSKWRKRGTKLHIFNDHIFIAKHFPGATPCQVCSKHMPRRIGKQGYECRDCQLRCHKMCHVKTDALCQNSTVNMLELSYEAYYAANRLHGNNALPVANGHGGSPNAVLHRRPLSVVSEE